MTNFKKAISVLAAVIVIMSLCVGVGAFASTPASQTITATAGQTVTITFTESDCYGVSGSITYSNRELFSSVTPGSSSYGQIREKSFILSSAEKVECTVTLNVKVSDSATVGSTCTVSFTDYLRVDNNVTLEGPEGLTKTVTVEVVEKAADPAPTPTPEPTPEPTTPTTPQAPTTQETTKAPTTTTPTPSAPTTNNKVEETDSLDLSALNKQISAAQGLTETDYTAESWAQMSTALTKAISARNAKTQNEINSAATALKNAVAALVRADEAQLRSLLESANTLLSQDELGALKQTLADTVAKAQKALESGDADAKKTAFDELNAAYTAYKAKLDELSAGKVVEVEKPVEVEPTTPFCNIAFHKLLIILLVVSVIINLGLGGLIGYYFYMRKKNMQDDTPLVDYDIDED